MKPGVAARLAAARALGRVARNGAYSNRVMGPESTDLSPRDARLTRYLGYGAIRYLLRVDRAVAAASSRPLDQIQDALLDALRIGAFELLFSSADQHGVVDSGAEAVRHAVGERAVGFANAVLRRVARDGEPPIPDWDRALRYGVPGWMYERVGDGLGPEAADAFFAGANEEPPVGIWAPDGLADAIASTPAAGIPGASYLDDGADVTAALGGGAMVVDPASTAVALAVQAQPGDFVLDMAAAPGNKTAQIWHAMAGEGRLVALDRNLWGLYRMVPNGIHERSESGMKRG